MNALIKEFARNQIANPPIITVIPAPMRKPLVMRLLRFELGTSTTQNLIGLNHYLAFLAHAFGFGFGIELYPNQPLATTVTHSTNHSNS